MKSTVLLILLTLVSIGFAQQKITTEKDTATLCWENTDPTIERVLIYVKDVDDVNGDWRLVGTTRESQYTLTRGTIKHAAYGVRAIAGNDTSEIHTSLDDNACSFGDNCGVECTTAGSWFVNWGVKKPTTIRIQCYDCEIEIID